MNKSLAYGSVWIFALCVYGCANIVTPSGGKKDTIPPQPDVFSPANGILLFSGNEIRIHFNEYIQLNDVFNQVVISPPMETMPDIKLKKSREILIRLKSPLRDSTTYTINFGQAIRDITEGNILQNFSYVFSTGTFLDSLEVSGTVSDALTGIPSDKAFAELYLASEDSFTTAKPYYFAKTDKQGKFSIHNIRSGVYYLYGLEDQNFNYRYDLPNEKIAFQKSVLVLDSNRTHQDLDLFYEDKIPQRLLEIKSLRYGQTRIVFALPADSVSIIYTGKEAEKGFFTQNSTHDTLYYWNADLLLTEHSFHIAFDTTDITKSISVKQALPDSAMDKSKNVFTSNVPPPAGGKPSVWDLGKNIVLTFFNPLDTIVSQDVTLQCDSTAPEHLDVRIDTIDRKKLIIPFAWVQNTNYIIHIPRNFTKDVFGLGNDSSTIRISTRSAEDYGNLDIKIFNHTGDALIFQLLKPDYSVLQTVYLSDTLPARDTTYQFTLSLLPPAIYKLRLIDDKNHDGVWTPGSLEKNILPEKVFIYSPDITLRANWDTELEWDAGTIPKSAQ